MSDFPSNKNYIAQWITGLIYSSNSKFSFYFPETPFRSTLMVNISLKVKGNRLLQYLCRNVPMFNLQSSSIFSTRYPLISPNWTGKIAQINIKSKYTVNEKLLRALVFVPVMYILIWRFCSWIVFPKNHKNIHYFWIYM